MSEVSASGIIQNPRLKDITSITDIRKSAWEEISQNYQKILEVIRSSSVIGGRNFKIPRVELAKLGSAFNIENLASIVNLPVHKIKKVVIRCIDERLPSSDYFVDGETLVICTPGCLILEEDTDMYMKGLFKVLSNFPNLEEIYTSSHEECAALGAYIKKHYIDLENVDKDTERLIQGELQGKLRSELLLEALKTNSLKQKLQHGMLRIEVSPIISSDNMTGYRGFHNAMGVIEREIIMPDSVRMEFLRVGNLAESTIPFFGSTNLGTEVDKNASTILPYQIALGDHGMKPTPQNPFLIFICTPNMPGAEQYVYHRGLSIAKEIERRKLPSDCYEIAGLYS